MAGDEGAGGQILNEGAIEGGGGGEIEGGQGFVFITAGEFEVLAQALPAASFQFIVQEQGQEFGGTESL